jgi:broad specificity phosphatase PhoE
LSLELVYETHSITLDNERGLATGWLDGELSERGRDEARKLGERRRDERIAAVYSSDLGRAVDTASIAFADTDIPVHIDARLRECNYGELNGRPVDEVTAVKLAHVDVPFPDGESYADVVERTRAFLADVVARHEGERIVVIAHSANRWALEQLLHGVPMEEQVVAPFEWQPGWVYTVHSAP